uniref:hypothetical protein n=1 Tax=Nonomuraea sp. CA-251285 TaxID=3240002 RepID=UPI003F497D87
MSRTLPLDPTATAALTAAAARPDGQLPPIDRRHRTQLIARGLATATLDYRETPCPQLGGAMTITPMVTGYYITRLGRCEVAGQVTA